MTLENKLQLLRKQNGYSQEDLADKIGITRQTISKWENGQAVPELNGLILLSELYGVTIDRIVKDNDECSVPLYQNTNIDINRIIDFLIIAKKNTYAAKANETTSSRTNSHDFCYEDNNGYKYYDSYLGGEYFAGEEAVWLNGRAVYAMNYCGRVVSENFSGDFLKAALRAAPAEKPFRGPARYENGDNHYECTLHGDLDWFQGYEEIRWQGEQVYECFFHGGKMG